MEDKARKVPTKDLVEGLPTHLVAYPNSIEQKQRIEYIKLLQQEEAEQLTPNLPSLNFCKFEN